MTDDTDRITVGEEVERGEPVSLPVIDVLAGCGFITGKSGSGKSTTASVVAEQLLGAGCGLLIVDAEGKYDGLEEEHELLHAGADEECDIQVSPEHAEELAMLALEENVPIILDVSTYLDTAAADEMLLAVARQLFAKGKKQKKPFLVLVEECHEYVPDGGGMTESGKMLVKIGKRGRKHGLGIVGISQRPADVTKDFITQCDWLVWHRLTGDNDTSVVGRILGNDFADRVEDLGDGEAFLDVDWNEGVRRVQVDRERTSDGGATRGLEEFERLESEIATLEAELEEKVQRIEELEAQLAEASATERDGGDSIAAEDESDATELVSEDQRELRTYEQISGEESDGDEAAEDRSAAAQADEDGETSDSAESESGESATEHAETASSGLQPVKTISSSSSDRDEGETEGDTGEVETEDDTDEEEAGGRTDETEREPDRTTIEPTGGWPQAGDTERGAEPDPDIEPAPETGAETAEKLEQRLSDEFGVAMETSSDLTGGSLGSSTDGESSTSTDAVDTDAADPAESVAASTETEADTADLDRPDESAESIETVDSDESADSDETADTDESADVDESATPDEPAQHEASSAGAPEEQDDDDQSDERVIDPTADRGARLTELVESPELRDEEEVVRAFVLGIEALDDVTRGMLEHYRQSGDDSPLAAHLAAGGSGERRYAYARTRTLRKAGLVEHVGGGRYRYRLSDLAAESFDGSIDEETLSDTVAAIEAATDLTQG